MLKINAAQMEALRQVQLRRFAPRLDVWLKQSSPGWAEREPQERIEILEEMLRVADRSGLAVETDYALFALIALNSGPNWRSFIGRSEVKELLEGAFDPQVKVMRLYELAFNAPAAAA